MASLIGCGVMQSSEEQAVGSTDIVISGLDRWLNDELYVAGLTADEVEDNLLELEEPINADELFYQGLLNQRLLNFNNWWHARDAFRQLQDYEALSKEQRQLARIFRDYNQNRINWYQRQADLLIESADLEAQLALANEERRQLQDKIQALTDLEAVISTKKE